MLNEETILKILKAVKQEREEADVYASIDPDFIAPKDVEEIFYEYYQKENQTEEKIRELASEMYDALFTWQCLVDFNYPKMNIRKKKNETNLDHLSRRLNSKILGSTYIIKDLFAMSDKERENVLRKYGARMA